MTDRTGNASAAFSHRPQLDGLRAFAVGAVLVHHFLPSWGPLPYGVVGVRLFFVLSGFLITSILLQCRDIARIGSGSRLFLARQFYARRFLRIFPLYYGVVAVLALLNIEPVRELIGWLLTYTLNVQMTLNYAWPDQVSHFWSLAVEEQFYVVWPWLILFLPRRALIPMTVLLVVAAPLARLYLAADRGNWVAVYTLTPALFDTLGAGALLAFLFRPDISGVPETVFKALWRGALPCGMVLVCVLEVLIRNKSAAVSNVYIAFYDLALGLVFFRIVGGAARGYPGWLGRFLEVRPLVYLGRISYGIYVYHAFVPSLTAWLAGRIGWIYKPHGLAWALVMTGVTVGLAALSWHLMEYPLNRLKRHFPYARSGTEQVSRS